MDSRKTGQLIIALRKELGMTQQVLASRLNVTNKAVSKWETGEGYPEITIFPALAEVLGVTADELLRGERVEAHHVPDSVWNYSEQTEYLINRSKLKFHNYIAVSVALAMLGLIIYTAIINMPDIGWVVGSAIGFGTQMCLTVISIVIFMIGYNNFRNTYVKSQRLFPEMILQSYERFSFKSFRIMIWLWAICLSVIFPIGLNIQFYIEYLPDSFILGGMFACIVVSFMEHLVWKTYKTSNDNKINQLFIKTQSFIDILLTCVFASLLFFLMIIRFNYYGTLYYILNIACLVILAIALVCYIVMIILQKTRKNRLIVLTTVIRNIAVYISLGFIGASIATFRYMAAYLLVFIIILLALTAHVIIKHIEKLPE